MRDLVSSKPAAPASSGPLGNDDDDEHWFRGDLGEGTVVVVRLQCGGVVGLVVVVVEIVVGWS